MRKKLKDGIFTRWIWKDENKNKLGNHQRSLPTLASRYESKVQGRGSHSTRVGPGLY